MPTSTGQRRRMRRIGALEFTLKGQPLKLTAFAEATDTELRRLFVPFHDLTNGTETYPGGRYLDLDRTATGVYDLDFNRAYHPFCLFNATYDCPVPPRENRLAIPVRAGEQLGATDVISAIVFDFDGVLADSEPLHLRAYQEVLERFGLSLPREKYYASYLGYDDRGVFTAVAEARDWPLDEEKLGDLIEEKRRVFDGLLAGGDVMYAGAAECVARLAAVWPLGIASGAARPKSSTCSGAADSNGTSASSSRQARPRPVSRRPIRIARRRRCTAIPPEACVAIEDSRWGIESAKAAGLWCIGITHTYPVPELLQADAIVSSLAELTPELIRTLT